MKKSLYVPQPIETQDVELSDELLAISEKLAKHVHEVWAKRRIEQGWTRGPIRDEIKKQTPCLIPYEELSEEEKDYDRYTSQETLRLLIKLGYRIVRVKTFEQE